MSNSTSGHLSTNGGLRGHSVGDIFPWRVMITGQFDALEYWIIAPNGKKANSSYDSYSLAYDMAEIFKELEEFEDDHTAPAIAAGILGDLDSLAADMDIMADLERPTGNTLSDEY